MVETLCSHQWKNPNPRTGNSHNKSTTQSENKDNPDAKVETNEKQPVASADTSTSSKDNAETKENAES